MARLRGAATAPFGRHLDPAEGVAHAGEAAIEDAGLTPTAIDALVVANAAAPSFTDIGNVAVWTAEVLGQAGTPALRVDTGPSSSLSALWVAESLIASGSADNVLLVGWEQMTTLPTQETTRILAKLMAPDEQRLDLSLPGLVAMLTSAYLHAHDLAIEDLAHLPVRAHALAANNPIAHFQAPITLADVHASRVIAEPLQLYHCAPISDGAAALVVSHQGPVELMGSGHATDHHSYARRRSPPTGFKATQQAARQAFAQAGIRREAVDVIELHDAFSVLEPVNLEDLGFAEPGRGLDQLPQPDEDPLTGPLVVNPSGGLKARGHPIGATGAAQVCELFDQLTGRAANQADQARIGLAHNIGGFGNNVHCTLLEATP